MHSAFSLLGADEDAVVVGGGSSLIAAHLASLTRASDTVVYMFGAQSDAVIKQANHTLQTLNAKRILW